MRPVGDFLDLWNFIFKCFAKFQVFVFLLEDLDRIFFSHSNSIFYPNLDGRTFGKAGDRQFIPLFTGLYTSQHSDHQMSEPSSGYILSCFSSWKIAGCVVGNTFLLQGPFSNEE